LIELRICEDGDWESIADPVEMGLPEQNVFQDSVGLTAIVDGEIRVVGGIWLVDEDTGYLWMKISKQISKHPKQLMRVLREGLAILDDSFGVPHILTYVDENFVQGDRLCRLMGLERTEESKEHENKRYFVYKLR